MTPKYLLYATLATILSSAIGTVLAVLILKAVGWL